jgi:hypothetical protein
VPRRYSAPRAGLRANSVARRSARQLPHFAKDGYVFCKLGDQILRRFDVSVSAIGSVLDQYNPLVGFEAPDEGSDLTFTIID